MTKMMPNTVRFFLSRQKIGTSLKIHLEKVCFSGKSLNYQLATKYKGWSKAVEIGISRFLKGLVRSVSQSGWCCGKDLWRSSPLWLNTQRSSRVLGFFFIKRNILGGRKNCSTATIFMLKLWQQQEERSPTSFLHLTFLYSPHIKKNFKVAFGTSKS